MRLTTIEQLRQYIIECGRESDNATLFIGSRKHGNTEFRIPAHGCTVAKGTLHSPDYTGIFWVENGHLRSRSCLDMNIPENGYNDYRVFTSKEEMDAYTLE